MNAEEIFEALMAADGIDALDTEMALGWIGSLIDLSFDLKRDDGASRALEWADALEMRALTPVDAVLLDYFRANAWHSRQAPMDNTEVPRWGWQVRSIQNQIFHLRRARIRGGFADLDAFRRCQILTNLANALSHVGRYIEAREAWSQALQIDPKFWMALGNRGRGFIAYAQALHDRNYATLFLVSAHRDLAAAVQQATGSGGNGDDRARAYFDYQRAWIDGVIDVELAGKSIELEGYSLGRSKVEKAYRRWALRECLFLNPLNDIGPRSVAARDFLSLPSFRTPLREPPVLIGFFNQLKQEFASARWEYFEGQRSMKVHFSDRGVRLINTLDYPCYGLAVEKMKTAYRIAYSLFDKIAFFLNRYMKLGIKDNSVYFRRIWREKNGDDMHPIRAEWIQSENWAFHGLFWLSKDLFDDELLTALDPDAQALAELRSHLEHKYVKVHEMQLPPSAAPEDDLFYDSFAYSIARRALEEKTLRILKLARAALIYLVLGMHREELRREEERGDGGLVAPMTLGAIEDSWKV